MLPKIVVCASDPIVELDILETVRDFAPDVEIEIAADALGLRQMLLGDGRQTVVLTMLSDLDVELVRFLGDAPHLRHVNFGEVEDAPTAINVTVPFGSEDLHNALKLAGVVQASQMR